MIVFQDAKFQFQKYSRRKSYSNELLRDELYGLLSTLNKYYLNRNILSRCESGFLMPNIKCLAWFNSHKVTTHEMQT